MFDSVELKFPVAAHHRLILLRHDEEQEACAQEER